LSTATVTSASDTSHGIPELKARKRDPAIHEMVALADARGLIRDRALLAETLLRIERWSPSALGKGVAVPHARSVTVRSPRIVGARSPRGIEWGAPDAQPVQLVLLVLAPAEMGEDAFFQLVARAVGLTRLQRDRQRLIQGGLDDAQVGELV